MNKYIWFLIFCIFAGGVQAKGIRNSKHNLSSHGPGSMKSSDTSMVCIFCHTTHVPGQRGKGPLWNREQSVVEYTIYESSSLYSIVGQPDGSSKLCLSCHDGTISLGHVLNRGKGFGISNSNAGRIPAGRSSYLGKNISDDHPVSFDSSAAVAATPGLVHPEPGDPVSYDGQSKIQCTSCHDPHRNTEGKFLVKSLLKGQLCKTCHRIDGFSGSGTHDNSLRNWDGSGKDPWPRTLFTTVAENSCYNCHHVHSAEGSERLLSSSRGSEVCLTCHNGKAGSDIQAVTGKSYSHSVRSFDGIHDPMENILTAAVHVQCVDCHNPHRANPSSAAAPGVTGRLRGVSGMSESGTLVPESDNEYEVCLKCHGQEKYNRSVIVRTEPNPDLRRALLTTNSSYHPVLGVGKASRVPSLKPGWNTSSRLYCIHCHNNNQSRSAGGSGPEGPHGSNYPHILEKNYLTAGFMPYQESNYDLCWKCHRPEVVLNENFSTFKYHKKHVEEESTPCSVCHDPHGSQRNPGLINFDTGTVFPNMNGELKFEVIGNKGYCYLQCHGDDHSPKEYEK